MRLRQLGRAIRADLKKDRQRRAEAAGEYVERILTGDTPLPREAWRRMRVWYRVVVDHYPSSAQVTLKQITVELLKTRFRPNKRHLRV